MEEGLLSKNNSTTQRAHSLMSWLGGDINGDKQKQTKQNKRKPFSL
jgi:hypothetical protein